ncbi:MAG: rod shape-determining protein MreD [Candidatus Omnitrophica bacterium]|nr:rod shape-determining protein MreD [Candidatus Omnitrophota bacterium]MBU1923811.1 rod shape-determining protein MreD [Candidatus Omnitrophota bacterium]
MKKWLILFTVIMLATLQLSWPVCLSIFNTKPDLLLIFTVSLVFYFNFKIALISGILAGLLKDAFLPPVLAINTVSFSVWSYLTFRLSSQISTENSYVRLVIILIIAVLNNTVIGIQSLNSGNYIPASIFLRNLLTSSVYTVVLSPLIFKLTKKIAG